MLLIPNFINFNAKYVKILGNKNSDSIIFLKFSFTFATRFNYCNCQKKVLDYIYYISV